MTGPFAFAHDFLSTARLHLHLQAQIYGWSMIDTAPPADYVTALMDIRDAASNPLIEYEEVPSPPRLAPYSAAIALRTVAEDHEQPRSSGRIVILHDPEEQLGWGGTFRIVAQLRSQIDPEMGFDPLLSEAVWNWAHDSLEEAGAGYHSLTGTVTRELSESFGGLELMGATLFVELRASWTPNTSYVGDHLKAWTSLMCRTSGVDADHHVRA